VARRRAYETAARSRRQFQSRYVGRQQIQPAGHRAGLDATVDVQLAVDTASVGPHIFERALEYVTSDLRMARRLCAKASRSTAKIVVPPLGPGRTPGARPRLRHRRWPYLLKYRRGGGGTGPRRRFRRVQAVSGSKDMSLLTAALRCGKRLSTTSDLP
jgi:hypothetical protein